MDAQQTYSLVDKLVLIDTEIKKLEAEIVKLNATLADPALYAKDPKRYVVTVP